MRLLDQHAFMTNVRTAYSFSPNNAQPSDRRPRPIERLRLYAEASLSMRSGTLGRCAPQQPQHDIGRHQAGKRNTDGGPFSSVQRRGDRQHRQ